MATHTYAGSGTHDVTLTVTDNEANTANVTKRVYSGDTGLVARFKTKKDESNPLKIWFNGEYSHDAAGNDVAYLAWDYGDGAVGEEGTPPGGYGDHAYWVSPTGGATWLGAKSGTPLSGSSCCTLAIANANVGPGDSVYLREGTYSTPISPSATGTASDKIKYIAYTGETPTITYAADYGITLAANKSYIKIDGVHVVNSDAFFWIGSGASYNEITNCHFESNRSIWNYGFGLITCEETKNGTFGNPSTHNWIHGNVFTKYGTVNSCSDDGTIRIGAGGTEGHLDPSCNNTFEDNVFSYAGHDCLDIGGRYNVARNNIFHQEEAYFPSTGSCLNKPTSGYFGNRCLILTNYGDGIGTANHNLVEGNRCGHAGSPPEDDGHNGIESAGYHTIIRFNYCFGNMAAGIELKHQGVYASSYRSSSRSRVYNNTLYHNGYDGYYQWGVNRAGVFCGGDWDLHDWPDDVVIRNNIAYDNYNSDNVKFQTPYTVSEGYGVADHNLETNPTFTNTSMADKTSLTLPDLSVQVGSGAIGTGINLTQANGAGVGSYTLYVDDADFFQDGSWGSSLSAKYADWIAVGTVGNIVQISSIDYDNNKIILTSPITWSDNDPVWLYKKSDGTRVLYGTQSDCGAYPYPR